MALRKENGPNPIAFASTALALLSLSVFGIIAYSAPRFKEVYFEMGIDLPLPTRMFLLLPGWLWGLAGIGLAAWVLAKDRYICPPGRDRANLVVSMGLVLLGLVAAVALVLPLMIIIEAMRAA